MNVIIDTDPGIDDALALFFALNSPELNIKAIVATYGNVRIQQAVRNVLNILEVVAPSDIPFVIQGAGHPIRRPLLKKDYRIHGLNGLGNLNLPPPSLKPADEELNDIFKKSRDIFLICLGPLTTLAKLILANPGVINSLKEIILMGGAVTVPGNVTQFAEFNIYSDPEAAKIVLHCKIPITMVGLDVTHQTLLTENELKLLDTSVPRFKFIDKICRHYIGFHKKYRRMKGCFLHDPLAVATAIDRNIVKTKRLSIDVQTEDKNRLGQTYIKKDGRPNADVCVELDNDRFMKLLRQRIFLRGSRV
ncbi:hypothetical protein AUJ66_05455 [Candidatus Desantisbacteria bacterium CG1_02_38_46]|uniref:Inosine/uridine-preferring nucleoside hydrolase domain-containing protein n=1 Tax=Candidatus Desantisbacteria bacterium CG1_02_38_46 TaxID=1817893 RepID=A0A1J4SF46_9BACT|nr:MAG: hypothetical protein AUJ66_05455 [Candidatus Desantisbacteria bacterium CG1_02_38_46]